MSGTGPPKREGVVKDSMGHGSNSAGGSLAGGTSPGLGSTYALFGQAMAGLQTAVAGRVASARRARAQDQGAAKELARGSQKSDPVPLHPGALGRQS